MIGRIDTFLLRLPGLWLALALTLLVAMPGFFTLPPVDRDEARFAQASAQMLESGDWIDIRLGDEARHKKPVGIYWLQTVTAAVTGAESEIWAYRLVSLLGALVAVGFTHATARLVLPAGPSLLAAVMLGVCLLLGGEARLAKTDAALLAAIMAGQYVLARLWLPGGRAQRADVPFALAMAFWVAQAASILIKGPIGPMVAVFTMAGLSMMRRDLALVRALRPVPGLLLMAALVAPWFVAITLRSDGAFWQASVGADMLAKIGQGQESHGAPPGTYLALVWATFWPGAMLLAAGIPALWRGGRVPLVQFALIWAVPVWIVFELTATKLVHYVLPAYPALALMAAWAMLAGRARVWIAGVLGVIPFVVLAGLGLAARDQGFALPVTLWVGAAGLACAVPLILSAYARGRVGVLALSLTAGGLALSVGVFSSLARFAPLWPAVPLAQVVADHPGCGVRVAGYAEPSVIFLTQNRVRFVDVPGAVAGFGVAGCQVIAVPAAELATVQAAAPDAVPVTRIDGMNIGNGKPLSLLVYVTP